MQSKYNPPCLTKREIEKRLTEIRQKRVELHGQQIEDLYHLPEIFVDLEDEENDLVQQLNDFDPDRDFEKYRKPIKERDPGKLTVRLFDDLRARGCGLSDFSIETPPLHMLKEQNCGCFLMRMKLYGPGKTERRILIPLEIAIARVSTVPTGNDGNRRAFDALFSSRPDGREY